MILVNHAFRADSILEVEPVIIPSGGELLERFFELARPLVDRARSHDSEELAQVTETLLPKLLCNQPIELPTASVSYIVKLVNFVLCFQ